MVPGASAAFCEFDLTYPTIPEGLDQSCPISIPAEFSGLTGSVH